MDGLCDSRWYELFSRGARDWLRHNAKVREAVRSHLPNLIASPDLLAGADRKVQVPVDLLEHARFRLAQRRIVTGAGQGDGEPGDLLLPPREHPAAAPQGAAGNEDGRPQLLLEFSMTDIVDWLWEDLKLPKLRPVSQPAPGEPQLVREGWDRHGARSRLDRRHTLKAALRRRAVQQQPAAFTNDDLRFRQIVPRAQPDIRAVVFFVLDVSASMMQAERRLAKTFFFFASQGIRRQYRHLELRFIAHATQAWEFKESEFFQVCGAGGTLASSAFQLALDLLNHHYDSTLYNAYLFYASDGENFIEDRGAAKTALDQLLTRLNYAAYTETAPGAGRAFETEMRRLFQQLERGGLPVASTVLSGSSDVWSAIRKFFSHQCEQKP